MKKPFAAKLESNTVDDIKNYEDYVVYGMTFSSQSHFIEWCVKQGMGLIELKDNKES